MGKSCIRSRRRDRFEGHALSSASSHFADKLGGNLILRYPDLALAQDFIEGQVSDLSCFVQELDLLLVLYDSEIADQRASG